MTATPSPLGTPLAYERIPERFNIVDVLVDRHLAEGRGERPAIVTPEGVVTYRGLAAGVARAAGLLTRLGVQMEQRVALLLPDSPEFAYLFFGAQKAGAVPVPLSTFATPEEVDDALADSRAVALAVHASLYPRVETLRRRAPALRHCLVAGEAPAGTLALRPALEGEPPSFASAPTSRDDMAYWLYSSGTTGRPKAVVHLHHDMPFCVEPYVRQVLGLTADDRTFAVPRLSFSYGLTSCLYVPLWVGASTILVPERPDPARVFEVWATLRPTVFFSVPTSYVALLREAETTRPDISSLRLAVSAGEPLPAALHARWTGRTAVELLDGLGATEVGYIYLSNRPGAVRPGATGQLLPGYRGRLADEAGRDTAAGTPGELWVAGESLAAGYWNQHERTRRAFVGEWYRTGDRFVVDEDGYFWFQGRLDDLLRVGANWVSPVEVEACLAGHPAVLECAVVGGRDGDGLEKPHAYVVLRPEAPAEGLTEALVALARSRLPPYKAPRWVTVVPDLPKSATGKVQRYRLRT